MDEQIIPSKTKCSSIRQYNPKKPKKWGFKNLVRAGSSGIMYDFFIYEGKSTANNNENDNTDYDHLQKSAQVVAKLCQNLPSHKNHKLFFDNWFSTLELMLYLKNKGILAVGTIRLNRLGGCSASSNKDLQKAGTGSSDYRTDNNSGIVVVKWVDNNVVQLISNFVGIEPMTSIERWCKKEKKRKDIPCPQIVKQYNKSMGGVHLADMLIPLYRIPCKTKRWYQKIFWHLIDIAKMNACLLYRRHYQQYEDVAKNQKSLLVFSFETAEALIHSNKVTPCSSRGRPPKRRSTEPVTKGKKATVPLPVHDVRYDKVGHLPEMQENKNRCRLCDMICRATCKKCNVYLCLLEYRNCFYDFHNV